MLGQKGCDLILIAWQTPAKPICSDSSWSLCGISTSRVWNRTLSETGVLWPTIRQGRSDKFFMVSSKTESCGESRVYVSFPWPALEITKAMGVMSQEPWMKIWRDIYTHTHIIVSHWVREGLWEEVISELAFGEEEEGEFLSMRIGYGRGGCLGTWEIVGLKALRWETSGVFRKEWKVESMKENSEKWD